MELTSLEEKQAEWWMICRVEDAWRETKQGRRRVLEVGHFSRDLSEGREELAFRPRGRDAPGLKEVNEGGGEMGK